MTITPARALASLTAAPLVAALLLAGCTDNTTVADGNLQVSSSADQCSVSADQAPSGNVVFSVTNTGTAVTEFYLLAEDGLRIVGEVENIAPSLTRDLVVRVPAGSYFTVCKPGMVGDGIRASFTVTDSGSDSEPTGDDLQLIDTATGLYASYVRDQTEQLLARTKEFVDLYKAGKDDQARALYPVARMNWERIEPVAESLGDLDPIMDAREADLETGQEWTGWHKIEKDLWPPNTGYAALTPAERAKYADKLLADTTTLHQRTRTMTYTVDGIANGSAALLTEVATGKVTGEEEIWSHTDLWDFQANVDGARVAFENLRPILARKDTALEATIDTRFTALQSLLDTQKVGEGWKLYPELSDAEVKELSDAVNALSEPLSQLTAAVLS